MSIDFLLGMITMAVVYQPLVTIYRWIRLLRTLRKIKKQFDGETLSEAQRSAGEWRRD